MTDGSIRLTATEIAQRCGVTAAAVSNWRTRHSDFPTARSGAGGETFDVGEVTEWLGARTIAANGLRRGEHKGLTYADRFLGSAPLGEARSGRGERDQVLGLVDLVRDESALVDVVVGLVALRIEEPTMFARLRDVEPIHLADELADLPLHDFRDLFPQLSDDAVDPALLFRLVDRVGTIALPDPSDRAERGRLAIRLVEACAAARGRAGDHTVPVRLVDLMVGVTRAGTASRVHDPFARAGELLVGAAIGGTAADASGPIGLSAGTVTGGMYRTTRAALLLAGQHADIRSDRMLARPGDDTYDVVLTNPPFGLVAPDLPDHDRRWRYGPPRHSGNFAWLQHVLGMLGEGGRAAVLMANSAGTTVNPTEQHIRAAMVEAGVVDAVVALPDRLFTSTAIAPSLWLLRPPPAGPAPDVLLVDATASGQTRHGRRQLSGGDVTKIIEACRGTDGRGKRRRPEPGFTAVVPVAELAHSRKGLNPRAHVGPAPSGTRGSAELVGRARDARAELLVQVRELTNASGTRSAVPDPGEAVHGDAVTETTVAAVCQLRSGPGRFDGDPHASSVPVVVPRGIRHNRIEDTGVVATADLPQVQRFRLDEGDVVCVRVGQLGRQGYVRAHQTGWLLGPGCLRIRPGAGVDSRYLTYYLGTAAALDWLDRHATGSAIRGLGARVLGGMPLVLPPLAEQRRIGTLLDTLDDEAEVLERASAAAAGLRTELAELLVPRARNG